MSPRRRLAATLLAFFGLTAGLITPAAEAHAPFNGYTILTDGGETTFRTFVEAPGAFTVERWGHEGQDGLTLGGQEGGVLVGAPQSSPRLSVGHYVAGRNPFNPDQVYFDVGSRQTGDSWIALASSVDVLDLSRDAQGRLTSLALDYTATVADSSKAPVWGSLRWNSTVPYTHTTATSFKHGAVVAGQTVNATVSVRNDGTVPQTYGAAEWTGSSRGPSVARDGCAGSTLAPGATCTLDVSARPHAADPVQGWLRIPDGTLRGHAYARVDVQVERLLVPELTATAHRGAVTLDTGSAGSTYQILRVAGSGSETVVAESAKMPWTDSDVTYEELYTYRVRLTSGEGQSEPSNALTLSPLPVPEGAEGTFVPIDPVRVLDTRIGSGARKGSVGPGETIRFTPGAGGHIPATGVLAVLLNVTGTEATQITHIQVWPSGDPRPETSSLNLVPGYSRPNQVLVPVGDDGQIALRNHSGSAHLIVDVQGYYSDVAGVEGSGFHPTLPHRYRDSRQDARGGSPRPLAPGEDIFVHLPVTYHPWTDMSAVDVNITVTEPTAAGYITAWPGDGPAPLVSNVNFVTGTTVANHSVVPVTFRDGVPGIALRNGSSGTAHVIVDVLGWYDDGSRADGLRFAPAPTYRVADTRLEGGRLRSEETLVIADEDLPMTAGAHVINLTATGAVGPGYLTAWDGHQSPPWTSTVNYMPYENAPNFATVRVDPNRQFVVGARGGDVHAIVDYVGAFY